MVMSSLLSEVVTSSCDDVWLLWWWSKRRKTDLEELASLCYYPPGNYSYTSANPPLYGLPYTPTASPTWTFM